MEHGIEQHPDAATMQGLDHRGKRPLVTQTTIDPKVVGYVVAIVSLQRLRGQLRLGKA